MNSQQARSELYHRLSEVIGADNATTLMSYLSHEPPATVRDLEATGAALQGDVAASTAALRAEIAASESALRTEMAASQDALRAEIAASESALRVEIVASVESLRGELRLEIQKVDDSLRSEMRVLNGRMDGFDERMGRFETRLDGFGDLLITQARTYAISTVTAVVGSVGLAAGLASIL